MASAIAEAKSKISEAELQAVRIDHDFRTEVMKDSREAQDKEAELAQKMIAARVFAEASSPPPADWRDRAPAFGAHHRRRYRCRRGRHGGCSRIGFL